MNAYVSKEELTLLPTDRISYPEHFSDADRLRHAHGGVFAQIRAWVVRYFQRQNVVSELNNLSDRELLDIGLSRSQIGLVFDDGFVSRRSR